MLIPWIRSGGSAFKLEYSWHYVNHEGDTFLGFQNCAGHREAHGTKLVLVTSHTDEIYIFTELVQDNGAGQFEVYVNFSHRVNERAGPVIKTAKWTGHSGTIQAAIDEAKLCRRRSYDFYGRGYTAKLGKAKKDRHDVIKLA